MADDPEPSPEVDPSPLEGAQAEAGDDSLQPAAAPTPEGDASSPSPPELSTADVVPPPDAPPSDSEVKEESSLPSLGIIAPSPMTTAFGDIVSSASSSVHPSRGPSRTPSPSSLPFVPPPPPPPIRRPPPPKKGILKPAKQPARGLLGSFIRPATLGGRLMDGATQANVNAGVGAVGTAVQQSGEKAGAFFSKAFGRISSVATGTLTGVATPAATQPPPPPPPKPRTDLQSSPLLPAPPPTLDPIPKTKLKKASFPLSHISVVYPISSVLPPYSEKTLASRDEVESASRKRREEEGGPEWWTERRLGELFEWALRIREEGVDEVVLRAVKAAAAPPPEPRSLDLAGRSLSRFLVEALSDVLSVRAQIRKVNLSSTQLTEEALKTLLCALLNSSELNSLFLRDNKKIKLAGWKMLAGYLEDDRTRQNLRFLDLSENGLDRRSVEVLMPGLQIRTEADAKEEVGGLETLRLDGCAVRGGSLEALAQGIRQSTIRHLSLRNNRIPSLGGVSLAVMIKDYPDLSASPFSPSATSPSATTTYTPYTPRSRRKLDEGPLPDIPVVASNSTGGITSRHIPSSYVRPGMSDSSGDSDDEDDLPPVPVTKEEKMERNLMQTRVRSLDDVQRLGRLVTLDLKGNDLRTGVTYIAQVLKRNRTLKVCNLSDNKIDVNGLVSLAEALKYNSTLDTLDLSMNPCCGPGLEGIHTLRHAFTLNANLKRLFLSATSLTTSGAIALAEFLPEATHLVHIDLTSNPAIETAGIMALAVGLRANKIVRCLDLTVGMGDEEGAGLSRDILQSCIRNTELAQDKSSTKAARQAVWAPIQRSTLARQAKEADSARAMAEAQSSAATPAGQARSTVFEMSPDEVESAAEEVVQSLTEGVEVSDALGVVVKDVQGVLERAKVLRERLEEMVQQSVDGDGGDRLQVLLGLMDRLTVQVDVAEKAVEADTAKQAQAIEDDKVKQRQPLKISTNLGPAGGLFPSPNVSTPVKNVPAEMASSPNFTLADSSDEDDDDDEEDDDDMGGLPGLPPPDSPTVQKSLKMVEEEGEVFRKGVVLGTADAEQGEEVSTEKLKQELLDAEVERQSPRRLSVDEATAGLPSEEAL